jgi:hypothetical protein
MMLPKILHVLLMHLPLLRQAAAIGIVESTHGAVVQAGREIYASESLSVQREDDLSGRYGAGMSPPGGALRVYDSA